jgi:hypothetical protein
VIDSLKKLFYARRHAYRSVFSGPNAELVLADLRRFCRATMPTADVTNERTTYLLEGRREVWLRIANHLQLSDEQIYKLTEDYPDE